MEKFIAKFINFITSNKFYGPIISILVGYITYKIISNIITKIMNKRKRKDKKENTVFNLIKSIIKYLIMIIVLLTILEIYGINTSKIIASLGIAGVVIGLALQDTIKNMLSGMFIIFDNRYNVGDTVKINDFTGEVINLGLQTTKLKSVTGEVFTISNSNINTVINYTQNDTLLVLEIGVNYNTDIEKLEKVLKGLNTKAKKIENVKGELNLLGLDAFNPSEMIYKISILCKPYTHFAVKRELLKLIKKEFNKHEIEIPYTQIDLHLIKDKTK